MRIVSFTSAIAGVFAVLLIAACSSKTEPEAAVTSTPPTEQEANWVNEEILVQLKELRKEVADLKASSQEIKELRAAVNRLDEKLSSAKVAAAPAPSAPSNVVPREVKLGDSPVLGKKGAKVAIAEFTDFQCPFCARHHKQVFPEIKRSFVDTGKVKYVALAYPLGFHDQAKPAAIAALCAGESGNYWAMHESLFDNAQRLGSGLFLTQAQELKLDLPKFTACLDDRKSAATIDAQVAYGNSLGVSGTPKFFVGRLQGDKIVDVTVINGAQPYSAFASAIESKLN
jgi:protein-disulfide isomerase